MSNEMQLSIVNQHLMPALTMNDAVNRFNATRDFVKRILKDGTDYGIIPGTDKPTLLKPGAEKLTTFFGLTVRFDIIEKTEDWTGHEHGGEAFFYYWFRCGLWRGTTLIAEADGSCNSWETKYRYRQGQRKCPKCGQTAIIAGRPEYGGGWLCWQKKGGCGAKFAGGDASIESQQIGRVPNPDPADTVNTVQKMSQKRALIAAVLLAVNASEYFTQDLEDLDFGTVVEAVVKVAEEKPATAQKPANANQKPETQKAPPTQAPTPRPGREKAATVSMKNWAEAAANLAQDFPHYANATGDPNFYHMTKAAALCGYDEINDANLADVIANLQARVQEPAPDNLPVEALAEDAPF